MRRCHFPPGTGKWNKIEHRLFSFISQDWRGKPPVSHEVIINLIAATTTTTGLNVKTQLDTDTYPGGLKISDKRMAELKLKAIGTTVCSPEVEPLIVGCRRFRRPAHRDKASL